MVNKKDIYIRLEREEDYREVEELVRKSFWNVYNPGATEHFILKNLRKDPNFISELDFVMEKNGKIIGQIVFVKSHIDLDDGTKLPTITIGPICIANEYKRLGYGKMLLDYSMEKAKEYGCKAVFLDGNIDFYGKSGFIYGSKKKIRYHGLPEGTKADFFLCKELEENYLDNISGEYKPPKIYFVAEENPSDFLEYDKSFSNKENFD